jgi:E3 ubiquitin-protein ligase EDD1
LISQDRRRAEHKSKERKAEITAPTEITQENFKFSEELQYWHDAKGEDFPSGVKGFTKIAATYSSLYAVGDNGKIYTWDWKSERPSNKAHSISDKLAKEDADEKICELEACPWRIAVLTNKNRVASFVDDYCGESLCSAFFTGFIELPSGLSAERLLVCPLYAAVLTSNNKISWWGVYPFVDRMSMFENVKKKSRDDLSNRSIVIGSEVRTRAIPIYANGSVGVNFSSGIPQIGVLMESAWTMTETCRFRVFSPDQYAIYTKERSNQTDGGSTVDQSSSASSSAQYKEEAWSLRNITFFQEEAVCDTAVVKIIDGSFVGIVYKSAIEQSERENNGVADEVQLLKNHIRLMRKDELIVVPTTKLSRSPQIHQRKLTEIKIPRRVSRILSAVIENNCKLFE